jgi:hypothetical protein
MWILRIFTFLVVVIVFPHAHADTPLTAPRRYLVESTSKKYVAVVDPKNGVEVRSVDSGKVLWKAPIRWSRDAFLADDGTHFVTGYDGLNLIPVNYSTNLALVTFYRRKEKIKEVSVLELFPNTNVLVRTASHYHWGSIQGITDSTLTVKRCDKKEVRFDITTGKIAK